MARSYLFEEFAKVVKKYPSKTAIYFNQDKTLRTVQYQELYGQVLKLGNLLRAKGIKELARAVILLGNQPEWPIAFFAVQYNGAVSVPIDINLGAPDIQQLVAHSRARIVLISEKVYLRLKTELEAIKNIKILVVDSAGFCKELDASPLSLAGEGAVSADDKVAAMFYTSGTTNLPKGVVLSQKNLFSNKESLRKLNIYTPSDTIISLLPLHHTYSFMVTCLLPLLEGCSISYPASLNSEDLLNCIRQTGVSIFIGVPQVFILFHRGIKEKLKKAPLLAKIIIKGLVDFCWSIRKASGINPAKSVLGRMHRVFGKRLKFMVTGGARLDPNITSDFYRWGFTVLEGYGLTETSPVATFNPPGRAKFGSVGKAIPDVEIKIVNPDAQGIGEVAIKGPNVMPGYYELPQDTARVLKEGWFYTGDLGFLDRDGYLFITGRKDELIVLTSGKKVNPEEIESYYITSPYVKEICVFEAKVDGFLEQVKQLMAVVVPDEEFFRKQGVVNIEDKIKWEFDNLAHSISDYKRIKGFAVVKEPLPRTRLGKLMRHKVVSAYLEKVTAQAVKEEKITSQDDKTLLEQKFTRKAMNYLEERLKRKINLSDHLELDLGFDSLGRVELLLEIQQYLNVEVPESEMTELFYTSTIRELLHKVRPYIKEEEAGTGKKEEILWSQILQQPLPLNLLGNIRIRPYFLDLVFTFFFLGIFKIIFRVFFMLEVKGKINLPKGGPAIIYANHTSFFDGFIIACCLPFKSILKTYFLGFKEYFMHSSLKNMVKSARLVPIDITFDLVKTLKVCSYLMKNNKVLCYFPEGQRAPSEEGVPFKKGIGILAKELNIQLFPVYIDGAFRAWPRFRMFPRLAKIKVNCGRSLSYAALTRDKPLAGDEYEALAGRLRTELFRLKKG